MRGSWFFRTTASNACGARLRTSSAAWQPGHRPRAHAFGLGPCARARLGNPGTDPRACGRPWTLRARGLATRARTPRVRSTLDPARARFGNPGFKPRACVRPWTLRARGLATRARTPARAFDLGPCARAAWQPGFQAARMPSASGPVREPGQALSLLRARRSPCIKKPRRRTHCVIVSTGMLRRAMTDMSASLSRLRTTPEEFCITCITETRTEHPGTVAVSYRDGENGTPFVQLNIKGWCDTYDVEFAAAHCLWCQVGDIDVMLYQPLHGTMLKFRFQTRCNTTSFMRAVLATN